MTIKLLVFPALATPGKFVVASDATGNVLGVCRMYQLTLTRDERKAFDWVGHRYATGDGVGNLLRQCIVDGHEWDDSGDIAFSIPEHVAWEISELSASEDSLWPCFADGLTSKMQALCDSIV